MNRFCPKCGSEKGPFIQGFCRKCYLEDHKLVELAETLEMEQCKHCGKVRVKGRFVEKDDDVLKDFVASQVKARELSDARIDVELVPLEEGKSDAIVRVAGKVDGQPLAVEAETTLKMKVVLCDDCMKVSSYYHEAILQLRYKEKPSQEEFSKRLKQVEELLAPEARKDSLAKVVDVKPEAKGFDVLIGSKHAAKNIAKRLANESGSKITASFKVTGRDKMGKEKKRYTFLVRL